MFAPMRPGLVARLSATGPVLSFPASAGEGRPEKIMPEQQPKSEIPNQAISL
jgi:hypothetical protein